MQDYASLNLAKTAIDSNILFLKCCPLSLYKRANIHQAGVWIADLSVQVRQKDLDNKELLGQTQPQSAKFL